MLALRPLSVALGPKPIENLVGPMHVSLSPFAAPRHPARASAPTPGLQPVVGPPGKGGGRSERWVGTRPSGHQADRFGFEPSPGDIVHFSITWSARASTDGGIVRPRALAVLRLMTSSNFVGCSTGRSAGLAPLRILST